MPCVHGKTFWWNCTQCMKDKRIDASNREFEKRTKPFPKIVCLCGSTRFIENFNYWRKKLTIEGNIVLSIEIVTTQTTQEDPQNTNRRMKMMLDELHLRKIDLADEVMILNVGGYMGESTKKELEYAKEHGKTIRYLESIS